MNDISRIRELAGLKEAELKKGLSKDDLIELDACLREAGETILTILEVCRDLTRFGTLVPEQQQRVDRMVMVLERIRKLDHIPVNARADLLDDTITAVEGFWYILQPFENVFVAPNQYKTAYQISRQSWDRCYKYFSTYIIIDD